MLATKSYLRRGITSVLFVFGAILLWRSLASRFHHEPSPRKGLLDEAPVTVIEDVVTQHDVPVFLSGLGTVQAHNTVTVRSRVDGELKKIHFAEGQDVNAGDLLAEIDSDQLGRRFRSA